MYISGLGAKPQQVTLRIFLFLNNYSSSWPFYNSKCSKVLWKFQKQLHPFVPRSGLGNIFSQRINVLSSRQMIHKDKFIKNIKLFWWGLTLLFGGWNLKSKLLLINGIVRLHHPWWCHWSAKDWISDSTLQTAVQGLIRTILCYF